MKRFWWQRKNLVHEDCGMHERLASISINEGKWVFGLAWNMIGATLGWRPTAFALIHGLRPVRRHVAVDFLHSRSSNSDTMLYARWFNAMRCQNASCFMLFPSLQIPKMPRP